MVSVSDMHELTSLKLVFTVYSLMVQSRGAAEASGGICFGHHQKSHIKRNQKEVKGFCKILVWHGRQILLLVCFKTNWIFLW